MKFILQPLVEFGYGVVSGCGSGALHQTCFVLLAGRGKQEGGGGGGGERDAERMLVAHVCEAPSTEMVCVYFAWSSLTVSGSTGTGGVCSYSPRFQSLAVAERQTVLVHMVWFHCPVEK